MLLPLHVDDSILSIFPTQANTSFSFVVLSFYTRYSMHKTGLAFSHKGQCRKDSPRSQARMGARAFFFCQDTPNTETGVVSYLY